MSLYLVVPPADKDRLKPLVRLIINQVARTLTEQLVLQDNPATAPDRHHLLLLIDEFPALGKLEVFQESLAYFAGYGLKAYLIAQDLTQLHAAYGRDESLVSNCHLRIASAPNRIETAELLSKMAGSMTVHHTTRTYTGGRLDPALMHLMAAEQATERRLLTPDEALRLPADDLLIFVAGHAPIYGRKIKYYNDREFTRRARISAPASADRRPPATGNTAAAEPRTPPAENGATALPPPMLPVDGQDTPRRPAPLLGSPDAPAPKRHAPRSWRRRAVLATDQEPDQAVAGTATPAAAPEPEPEPTTERPARAPAPWAIPPPVVEPPRRPRPPLPRRELGPDWEHQREPGPEWER